MNIFLYGPRTVFLYFWTFGIIFNSFHFHFWNELKTIFKHFKIVECSQYIIAPNGVCETVKRTKPIQENYVWKLTRYAFDTACTVIIILVVQKKNRASTKQIFDRLLFTSFLRSILHFSKGYNFFTYTKVQIYLIFSQIILSFCIVIFIMTAVLWHCPLHISYF